MASDRLEGHAKAFRALSQGFDETAEQMQRLDINDPVAGAMLNIAAAFERSAQLLEERMKREAEQTNAKP